MDILMLVGFGGIVALLLGYFLLVIDRLKPGDNHFILLNVVGAVLILIALHGGGSVPLFPGLVVWLLISLYGLYKRHVATTA